MKTRINKKHLMGIGLAAVLIASVALIDSLDLLSGNTGAEAEPKGKIVTVTGEGAVTVKPDVGYLSLGVEISDVDASKAHEMNKAAMDRVIKVLLATGIAEEDIKTVYYSVWRGIDYNRSQDNQMESYHVTNQLEVTINNLDQTGAIIDACVAEGANVSGGVRFSVKDQDGYYQQALAAAMKQAQSKAQGIMSTFGAKPGKPWRVTEVPRYDGPVLYAAESAKAMDAGPATPILSGEMEIKATVTVEYDY